LTIIIFLLNLSFWSVFVGRSTEMIRQSILQKQIFEIIVPILSTFPTVIISIISEYATFNTFSSKKFDEIFDTYNTLVNCQHQNKSFQTRRFADRREYEELKSSLRVAIKNSKELLSEEFVSSLSSKSKLKISWQETVGCWDESGWCTKIAEKKKTIDLATINVKQLTWLKLYEIVKSLCDPSDKISTTNKISSINYECAGKHFVVDVKFKLN
jgi:hypothetical protein